MKPCRYRSEGSDSRPYRMVPMCACGWSGDVEEGQDAVHHLRSLQQWQRHVEKRVEALEKGVATYTQTVRRLLAAEDAYGCGFYDYTPWLEAYTELAALAGMRQDWVEGKWLEGGKQDGNV